MNLAGLNKRAQVFRDPACQITLHQASARKDDDCADKSLDMYAFDVGYSTSGIRCLDFDRLKLALYPPTPNKMTPCSVDALSFELTGTYLIEFKFKTASFENITRKAYDSVMLMIEHGGYTFSSARAEFSYVVVSTAIADRVGGKRRTLGRGYAYCKEPWKKFRNADDHWRIYALEDVVVKEAYCMHPATFDYFAKLRKFQ